MNIITLMGMWGASYTPCARVKGFAMCNMAAAEPDVIGGNKRQRRGPTSGMVCTILRTGIFLAKDIRCHP